MGKNLTWMDKTIIMLRKATTMFWAALSPRSIIKTRRPTSEMHLR
jgi:hypothetical protein